MTCISDVFPKRNTTSKKNGGSMFEFKMNPWYHIDGFLFGGHKSRPTSIEIKGFRTPKLIIMHHQHGRFCKCLQQESRKTNHLLMIVGLANSYTPPRLFVSYFYKCTTWLVDSVYTNHFQIISVWFEWVFLCGPFLSHLVKDLEFRNKLIVWTSIQLSRNR